MKTGLSQQQMDHAVEQYEITMHMLRIIREAESDVKQELARRAAKGHESDDSTVVDAVHSGAK